MNQIINAMMGIGQSAKICSYKKKNCNNDADGLGLSGKLLKINFSKYTYKILKKIQNSF